MYSSSVEWRIGPSEAICWARRALRDFGSLFVSAGRFWPAVTNDVSVELIFVSC